MIEQTTHSVSQGNQGELNLDLPGLISDALLQEFPVPTLLLDPEGRVSQVNHSAKAELEGLAGDPKGLGVGFALRCVHATEQPYGCGESSSCQGCLLRGLVTRTLQTGQPHRRVEVEVVSRRGSEQRDCCLLVSTAVLTWPQGRRILVCLEDITARKRAESDLRKALQRVERLQEQLQSENFSLREQIRQARDSEGIVGSSEEFRRALEQAEYAAGNDTSVLITGETGTGKGLIARMIHERSARRERPLITVNCAALSSGLIESELFGHVGGAFTGALADKVGRFELAHRGTIFLDEVAELPIELQVKLLRVLEDGQFERVGSSETQTVDVRIIAATNRNLQKLMAEGALRSDLYYRLAVFPINVPPVRVRRQDIPLLVWHFIATRQTHFGKNIARIPKAVMEALTQYDWPGNVREIRNIVERALIISAGSTLQLAPLLAAPVKELQVAVPYQDIVSIERAHVTRVLEDCQWKINGRNNAAERLDLKPSTLRSRMKKLGIKRPQMAS